MWRRTVLLSFVVGSVACGKPMATVDGVAITNADADRMRALFQPPPSEEGAARLAVDAALAHRALFGWLDGSSAKARRDAYTEVATQVRKSSSSLLDQATRLEHAMAAARCRYIDGHEGCAAWDVEARPASRRLRRFNVGQPLLIIGVGSAAAAPMPLEYLRADYADAVARLNVGESVMVNGVELRLEGIIEAGM